MHAWHPSGCWGLKKLTPWSSWLISRCEKSGAYPPPVGWSPGFVFLKPLRGCVVFSDIAWRPSKLCERWTRRNTSEECCLFLIELYEYMSYMSDTDSGKWRLIGILCFTFFLKKIGWSLLLGNIPRVNPRYSRHMNFCGYRRLIQIF